MKIKCPLCDFENEEGSKFCKNCNIPLSKQDYSEDNPYIKKKGKEEESFQLISNEEVKAETEEGKYNMNIKPVDVIFLERADGHKVGDEFPNYFEYQYGTNPDSLLEKALTNNFLIKSDSCKWQVEMHLARKTILHLLERKKWFNPPLLFEF